MPPSTVEQLHSLLKKAQKVASEAEVFYSSGQETPVKFEANRLKMLESEESTGVALRIIAEGRIGFAATYRASNFASLLDAALETAPFGAQAKFHLPSPASAQKVEVYDSALKHLSVEDMAGLGQRAIDEVRRDWPELLCEAGVTKGVSQVRIMNSAGLDLEYSKTYVGFGLEGTLIRGTDMLFVGDSTSSCRVEKDTSKVVRRTLQQLELARQLVPAPAGDLPVVFTPHAVAGVLLGPLLSAFNGKTILQGASPLGKKLGQRAFDPRLSIWDEPHLAWRPGARPFDGEGVPTRRLPLIDHGVVGTFLYDLQTAGQAGTQSTGSASRGVGSLPAPSTSTLVVSTGEATFDQMVADIKDGLVVEQLIGAGQGNILGGDFSGNVLLGYRIQGGRITGRVKDTMIAGNVYRVLGELAGIGKEAEWVGGGLCTPHLYAPKVSIASKG